VEFTDLNKFLLSSSETYSSFNDQNINDIDKFMFVDVGNYPLIERMNKPNDNMQNEDDDIFYIKSNHPNIISIPNYSKVTFKSTLQEQEISFNMLTHKKEADHNLKYINELMEVSSFSKNINDRKMTLFSTKIETELFNSRKNSDDVTPKNNLRNFNINNINFIEKEMIFKSEKIRRQTATKSQVSSPSVAIENEDDLKDPKKIKLVRNRISAKRSRAKKKIYIQELEDLLKQANEELEHYKRLANTKLEDSLKNLAKKELEFVKMKSIDSDCNYLHDLKQNKIKKRIQRDSKQHLN